MDQHQVTLPTLALVIALAFSVGVAPEAQAIFPGAVMFAASLLLDDGTYGMDPFETSPAVVLLAAAALVLFTTVQWSVNSATDVTGLQWLLFLYAAATVPMADAGPLPPCVVATIGTTAPTTHAFTPAPSGPNHPAVLESGVQESVNLASFVVPADHGYAVQLENQCGEDIEIQVGGSSPASSVQLGDGTPVPVPELGTLALAAAGLVGVVALAVVRRRS